jgi:hypothetical protein
MKKNYRRIALAIFTLLLPAMFTLGCGGSTTLQDPTVNLTGTWTITETITSANSVCSGEVGEIDVWTANVVQNGNDLTVTVTSGSLTGATFTGTISGDNIDWSGSYPDSGGTTNVTSTDLTATNTTLSGTASWTWSDGADSCSGQTQIAGVKT